MVANHALVRLVQAAVPVLAAFVGSACITAAPLGPPELNHHTRLDRAPLTPAQRPDAVSVQSLYQGLHRTRSDQIVSQGWPAGMDGVISSLPQATCVWLGRDGHTGEALRLNWEYQAEIPAESRDTLGLTDEITTVAHCRLNDPITRQPPRGTNGSQTFVEYDPSRYENKEFATVFQIDDIGDNWPRLMSDLVPFFARMDEYPTQTDALNSCSDTPVADPAGVVQVTDLTLNYNGLVKGNGVIASCSGPFGRVVFPARDAMYEMAGAGGSVMEFLGPAVKVAEPNETLARALADDGNTLRWSTPVQGNSAADIHWEETFSRRIQVTRVRFFALQNGTRTYLDTGSERLCIHDPRFGSGCHWRCDGTAVPGGTVFRMQADGNGVEGCREGDQPADPPEYPAVTPVYAKEWLCDANADPNCEPLLLPLEWSIAAGVAGGQPAYIEFELEPVFEDMALRVAPTGALLGPVPVGERVQANFEIGNSGGVPIVIDDVQAIPHPQSAVDSNAMALHGEEAFPLPLKLDADGLILERPLDYPPYRVDETQEPFTRLIRETLADDTLTIQGETVAVQGRFIIRDQVETTLIDQTIDDEYHPFHGVSFVERVPPFTLMPDEAAPVLVSVAPTAYQGLDGGNGHLLWLHVEGYNQGDPLERQTADIPIALEALMGPALHTFPASISLPFRGMEPPAGSIGSLVVANYGDMSLSLIDLDIGGRDAARFNLVSPPSLPLTLAPGDATVIRVQYHSLCDSNAWQGHQASLELSTGHHGGVVALWGAADCTLNLP